MNGRWVLWFLGVLAVMVVTETAQASPFVINEVVNNPRQDHNDATPFDATPGVASPNAADEYVELLNVAVTPQSLEGYYLEMTDSDSQYDCFTFDAAVVPPGPCAQSEVYRVFDSAGVEVLAGTLQDRLRAVPAGGYVVLGNPPGDMLTAVTTALVETATIDSLVIDFGTTWAGDESASRFPDGVDTGIAADDIVPRRGTPGASNGELCSLATGDVVINEIISAPQRDWDADGGGTPFDGTPGIGAAGNDDELVELKNTSGAILDLTDCVLDLADSTREKFAFTTSDAPASPYVRVFDENGALFGTASDIDEVPAGGYVVVGNPPGTMNVTDVAVSLVDSLGALDSVLVDPGASSLIDEATARFPDGADTGVDTDDFSPLTATPGRKNGTLCTVNAGDAVLNEVITDPQQDWNNDAGGTPFDGTAGLGTADADDELIEIKNTTGGPIDLVGCVLTMTDTTPEKLVLQAQDAPAEPYVRVFDDTGAQVGTATALGAVPAGGYVLVGDPPGSLNNAITLGLTHDLGVLDALTVDANADGLLDQSAARFPDGADTDVDADDIFPLRATPGRGNGARCPLAVGDAVINEVVSDAQQDWDHDGAGTAFDGTPGGGLVDSDDELIELANTSGAEADFVGCVLEMTDSSSERMVLQPLDAPADPYVRVFDAAGTLVGTATALSNVPIGGFVLIGDPPATLNNDVIISLLSDAEIDGQSFGDDAPDLNASSIEDEAAARLPNGADTDVGADDFKLQRATPGANNELDECTLGLANCDALASCTDTAAGFDCTCPPGYLGTGEICTDANECQAGSHDCDENATCMNTVGSFTCACLDGFTGDGKTCVDVDECAGGGASCGENASCNNTPGSFICACDSGYEGDGQTCDDVDECVTDAHDCHEDAFCTNTDGSFDCTCQSGFEGDGRSCEPTETGGPGDDPPADDGGCDCAVVSPPAGNLRALWLAGALALLTARRRRSA